MWVGAEMTKYLYEGECSWLDVLGVPAHLVATLLVVKLVLVAIAASEQELLALGGRRVVKISANNHF